MRNAALSNIGEFGLIDRIFKSINASASCKNIFIGPGDDAFAGRISRGLCVVGTVDLLVEDVHFRRGWASAYDIGYKALAVNLSDLAAMGSVKPLFAMTGIALDKNTDIAFVVGLYKGMQAACFRHGVKITGGDTVSSRKGIFISVSLLGEAKKEYLLKRTGAKPGDLVACTNTFGDSGAGLYILDNKIPSATRAAKYLVKKHLRPEPRFGESKILAEENIASSLIDASDGLDVSLKLLSEASNFGMDIELESIPLSKELVSFASDRRQDPVKHALYGGEDYELVFTLKRNNIRRLLDRVPSASIIGCVTDSRGVRYFDNGKKVAYDEKSFEHFKA